MKYTDIMDKVFRLPEYLNLGSEGPKLSKPMLFNKDDKKYCVMMAYDDVYEGIPSSYLIFDLKSNDVRFWDTVEAMDFLGMPDEVLMASSDGEELPDPVPDDLYDRFDECLEGNMDGYEKYLSMVIDCAMPASKRFYRWFLKQG